MPLSILLANRKMVGSKAEEFSVGGLGDHCDGQTFLESSDKTSDAVASPSMNELLMSEVF